MGYMNICVSNIVEINIYFLLVDSFVPTNCWKLILRMSLITISMPRKNFSCTFVPLNRVSVYKSSWLHDLRHAIKL